MSRIIEIIINIHLNCDDIYNYTTTRTAIRIIIRAGNRNKEWQLR